MIRALVIDDEPLARSVVREYLSDYPDIELVGECSDGFEGIKAIQQWHPDLVFLDVQMPRINGFEMLELVEDPPAIIFTTAYDEYAIRAFDIHATDYLLKPFSKERFQKSIQKFTETSPEAIKAIGKEIVESAPLPSQQNRIVVKNGSRILIIAVEDVYFLEAADDYVKIHCKSGAFLKNRTMSHFEKSLDPQSFVRTHRSYILNIREITRIEPLEKENFVAILRSGAQVPVSKSGYPRLKATLGW